MSNLSSLKSIRTSKKARRVGRGAGSTKGKTSARGHKGYKARTGSNSRLKFEGGQMSILKRIPKLKGFKPNNPLKYKVINIGDLEKFAEKGEVLKKNLLAKKILRRGYKLKLLGGGELKTAVKVEADFYTAQAKEKLEKAGGSILPKKEKKTKK